MITEKERGLLNALLKAFKEDDEKNGPGLFEAVRAYTGAIEIIHPACSNELILEYGSYRITYSAPDAYLE